MKNPVKALAATAFLAAAFLINTSAIAPDKPTIKKIIIKGNANVILVQRDQEEVVIAESFNSAKTSISTDGISLVINSQEQTPVTIRVYAKAPFRIEAFNTSRVETVGSFDLQYLQVFLNDKAAARINSNTEGLYTRINHSAKLILRGKSEDHVSVRSIGARIETESLACLKTNTSYFVPTAYTKKLTAKNLSR